jgi:hypothetical protein
MPITSQIGSSSLIKPGVCTSTTRPASPYEGQVIYETDTDKVLVWNGTAWYPNWNTAWGIVANTIGTTNTIASGILTPLNTTFTAVANRTYKISAIHPTIGSTIGDRLILSFRANGTIIQRYADYAIHSSFASYTHVQGFYASTFTAGSVTITVDWNKQTGNIAPNATANEKHQLLIEDIGPA